MTDQHPARTFVLQLLQRLGYAYLTPEEALALRGGKPARAILEQVLAAQLARLNVFRHRDVDRPFSDSNIAKAVRDLAEIGCDGLLRSNRRVYRLLNLGKTLQESIAGHIRSFPLFYIDFANPVRNTYHVTTHFALERPGRPDVLAPDIVLFVNGIPLVVIECRFDGAGGVDDAIATLINYQANDQIPNLFAYTQLLLALGDQARYGTPASGPEMWSVWQEPGEVAAAIRRLTDTPEAEPSAADLAIYSLCRPRRLLELVAGHVTFAGSTRLLARCHEFFCVRGILERVRVRDTNDVRRGGLVWFGDRKGRPPVMARLARALIFQPDIEVSTIILVGERAAEDDRLYDSLRYCGSGPVQARTGAHLVRLGWARRGCTTIVMGRFKAALRIRAPASDNPDVFVVIEDLSPGQSGELAAKIRKVLPKACLIAFTDTPVTSQESASVDQFGGLLATYKAVAEERAPEYPREPPRADRVIDPGQAPAVDEDFDTACRRQVLPVLDALPPGWFDPPAVAGQAASAIAAIVDAHRIVDWPSNIDVQNQMRTAIEEMLFALGEEHGFSLSFPEIDAVMEQSLAIARKIVPTGRALGEK